MLTWERARPHCLLQFKMLPLFQNPSRSRNKHRQRVYHCIKECLLQQCFMEQGRIFLFSSAAIKYQAWNCICVIRLDRRWNGTVWNDRSQPLPYSTLGLPSFPKLSPWAPSISACSPCIVPCLEMSCRRAGTLGVPPFHTPSSRETVDMGFQVRGWLSETSVLLGSLCRGRGWGLLRVVLSDTSSICCTGALECQRDAF